MPRSKNYVRTEALAKARNAFWQHGYDALGVRAIEDLTGLNRFAIQTDFGGKEGLFLEALENYAHHSNTTIIEPLAQGDLSAIERFFTNSAVCSDHGPRDPRDPRGPRDPRDYGCLMVNTVVENAAHQRDALKNRTDEHFKTMLAAFKSALRKAQTQGDLTDDFDIAQGASFLLALAMGIQVHIRMTGSVAAAKQQADMALKTLNCWRAGAG